MTVPTVDAGLRKMQIHVDLGDLESLDVLVDTLTDEVVEVFKKSCSAEGLKAARPEVEARIRALLHEHIVAYDICGLARTCDTSVQYDPWK